MGTSTRLKIRNIVDYIKSLKKLIKFPFLFPSLSVVSFMFPPFTLKVDAANYWIIKASNNDEAT